MTNEKSKMKEVNYFIIFIWIAIGLLIISIVFPFFVNCFFSDWSKSGTFGDTFGALNTLFSGLALAGVIVTIMMQKTELKNQQHELSLQRSEMQETRKEFLVNRATNIVYNQLDRFEKNLGELTITYEESKYVGNDAISLLDSIKKIISRPFYKQEEEYNNEMKAALIKLIKYYSPNKSEFEKFAHNAYNSVAVLKRVIFKTNLEINELNDLKNLFFVNIGFINMGVIEYISDYADVEIKYLKVEDYWENDIEVGVMQRANIFFKSIKQFYRLQLTNDNFETEILKWKESFGNEG